MTKREVFERLYLRGAELIRLDYGLALGKK